MLDIHSNRREINRRLAEMDVMINATAGLVPITIEQFKAAAIKGDSHAAEKAREEVIRIQGEIMDHIYARATLMRQAGYI